MSNNVEDNNNNQVTGSNNTIEAEGGSKKSGIFSNILATKKTLLLSCLFLFSVICLGFYLVDKLSGKQDVTAGGVSIIKTTIESSSVSTGELVEQNGLSGLIFDDVEEDEKNSVETADNLGKSFFAKVILPDEEVKKIPVIIDKSVKNNEKPINLFNLTAPAPAPDTKQPVQSTNNNTPQDDDILQAKILEYEKLLEKFLKPSGQNGGYFDFTEVDDNKNSKQINKQDISTEDVVKNSTNNNKGVRVGDVFYARLAFNLNTDFKTDVIAHIVDDKLSDAILIGSIEHNEQFEKMVLTFHSIDINGAIKPFKAIAIDTNSDLAGVADSVNNHYFQRFVLPVLLGGLGQAAEIYTNQGIVTSSIGIGNDVVSKAYEGGDKQVVAGLITGGVDVLKTVFSKGESRPVTVLKNKDRLLKIIALSSI